MNQPLLSTQNLAPAPGRPLLGVTRSALGRPWRERLDTAGAARALAMTQVHGHPELLARVLAGRGVALDEAALYLDPTLRRLMPDPSRLADMDAAAARLAAAIRAGEKVAIFGDYDVDGAASAALLADFLTAAGTPHHIHIPDRIFEGYGPNVPGHRGAGGGGGQAARLASIAARRATRRSKRRAGAAST